MTESNLNIILTNAECCISRKASELSNLYSIGNKCVDSELTKLKILEDKVNILKEYYYSNKTILNEPFNTGIEFNDPPGWNGDWFWTPIKIVPGASTAVDATSGLIAYESFNFTTRSSYREDLLTVGKNYNIQFQLCYDSSSGAEKPSNIRIGLGSNFIEVNASSDTYYTFNVEINGVCEDNTTFTIEGTGIESDTFYAIDNIIITTQSTCLTEEQIEIIIHDIMKQCDICDCQLKNPLNSVEITVLT